MTVTILGTSRTREEVYEAAKEIGYEVNMPPEEAIKQRLRPLHKTHRNLQLQIHTPAFFKGVEGIATEIEFQDNANPENYSPECVAIMRKLHEKIPDLKQRETWLCADYPPTPIRSLAQFLESLRG